MLSTKEITRALAAALGAVLLGSCGGGGDSGGDNAPPTGNQAPIQTGQLDDLDVVGLGYQTPTLTGTTDDTGSFRYRCPSQCEVVTFRLGGITLGTTTGGAKVLLADWQGGMSNGVLSESTLRRAQLLYALDSNADPTDGVKIDASTVTALNNRSLNFESTSFDNDIATLIDALRNDATLSASFRSAITLLPRSRVRALLEQAIAKARGVWVERPTAGTATEVRKYVVTVSDSLRIPYTGNTQSLRERYSRGLLPAVGAALTVTGGSSTAGWDLSSITTRGIHVAAPKYSAGGEVRLASVLVTPSASGAPATATLRVTADAASLPSLTPLTTTSGTAFSGRPTPIGASGSDGARNLNESLQPVTPEFDQQGIHPSGIARASDGSLWVCDQYGPFLMRLDAQGRSVDRWGPAGNLGALPDVNRRLPAIFEARQPNLGCGGLAISEARAGSVLLALAAPLDVDGRTRDRATVLRVLDFDSRTQTSRQFAVGIEPNEIDLMVLDIEALDAERMLALLRYRPSAGAPFQHEVRVWDLTAATDISTRNLTHGPNAGRALEYGTTQEVTLSGVTRVTQRLIVRLQDLGWTLPDATGLARGDSRTLFIMANVNGGVISEIRGGDPALSVAAHQVTADGLITPRASTGAPAPQFGLSLADFEAREIILWSINLRDAL